MSAICAGRGKAFPGDRPGFAAKIPVQEIRKGACQEKPAGSDRLGAAGRALVVASRPVAAHWNSFARGGLSAHGYYPYTPRPYYNGYLAVSSYAEAEPVVNVIVPPPVIV